MTEVKGRCPECRKPFTYPLNRGAKNRRYCSARCRRAAETRRRREARRAAAALAPPRRPRRPLPDDAWSAVTQIRKGVERLERVFTDDRFAANRFRLAGIRSLLQDAADDCARMASELPSPSEVRLGRKPQNVGQ